MAAKKTKVIKNENSSEKTKLTHRSNHRRRLMNIVSKAAKEGENQDLASRQVEVAEDSFLNQGLYGEKLLLQPSYSFASLYSFYEESDALQTCIEAIIKNVDGFGYTLQFLGDDLKQQTSNEALKEKTKAENIFDQINDEQSFRSLRKDFRKEYEIIGISGFEIIRNKFTKEIMTMHHAKFLNIRMTQRAKESIDVKVPIKRNGEVVSVTLKKYFRKYAQMENGKTLRWFKEYGDPRVMDATTGEYMTGNKKPKMVASEILAVKNSVGNEPYGLPRWIGAILQVLGRRNAQYINYDLFESQGIPPMAVMVSGGVLNDESLDELENVIRSMRGVEKWNRILILESLPNSTALDDKGGAKIELKNLSDYRNDDQMFSKYLEATKSDIRGVYRLPDMYTGENKNYTHSTAKTSQKVAEEQIFDPERQDFDEVVNFLLMVRELGIKLWKYVTKGPRLAGADDIAKGVETFGKAGAFTINNAIEQTNKAFNITMSKFDEKWANYPFPIVVELIKLGRLKLDFENAEPITPEPDSIDDVITPDATQIADDNLKKIASIIDISEDIPDDEELESMPGITPGMLQFLTTLRKVINTADIDKEE